jgi:predicted DNA binding CopG/RHH family protein
MVKALKPVPEFADESEERAYWERTDSTDHVDWSRAGPVRLPNLRPSTTAISLRLPVHLLDAIKIEANKRDMPYQSLIKIWFSEKVEAGVGGRIQAATPS